MNGKELMQERSRSLESLRHLRLMALLRDLERDEGRVKTAELLGISYRTLVRAVESGRLTGRMSDALERMLLSGGGLGCRPATGAVRRPGAADALSPGNGSGGVGEGDAQLPRRQSRTSRSDGELGRWLDEGAQAVGELAGRVARRRWVRPGRALQKLMVQGGSGGLSTMARSVRGVQSTKEPAPERPARKPLAGKRPEGK